MARSRKGRLLAVSWINDRIWRSKTGGGRIPINMRGCMDADHGSKKRPMASSRQVSLFRREIKERLSPTGFELLLQSVKKISEGQISATGRYYGSTMLTLDLAGVDRRIRDECDVATALRVAQLLQAEPDLLHQLRELALKDARRIARRPMLRLEADLRVRADGCRVLVDLDLEGEAAPTSARTNS